MHPAFSFADALSAALLLTIVFVIKGPKVCLLAALPYFLHLFHFTFILCNACLFFFWIIGLGREQGNKALRIDARERGGVGGAATLVRLLLFVCVMVRTYGIFDSVCSSSPTPLLKFGKIPLIPAVFGPVGGAIDRAHIRKRSLDSQSDVRWNGRGWAIVNAMEPAVGSISVEPSGFFLSRSFLTCFANLASSLDCILHCQERSDNNRI